MTFQKGQSGNPAGRPEGARSKLGTAFLEALYADFKAHGATALEVARIKQPTFYLDLVARMLPKEVNVRSDHTVTRKSESIPETTAWVAGTLGKRSEREAEESLPN